MVDDTASKCRLNPRNLILAPTYDVSNYAIDCGSDDFLMRLTKWLTLTTERLKYIDQNNSINYDIRDLLEKFPV